MARKLVPIVEGHGEETAVPVLLRKILHEHHQMYDIKIDKPIRRPRGELAKCDGVARWTAVASGAEDCAGIVIIFDVDDDCAATLGPQLRACAQQVVPGVPVYVVLAVREYEAWLLASMDSMKGKAGIVAEPALPPDGPESVRAAKAWVERNMTGQRYSETVDQAKLTAMLDVSLAHQGSRSFRKLFADMSDFVARLGETPVPL